MKIPLSWLKEYVDIDLSVTELAEMMTMAGLEVEHIHYIGLPGSDLVWDKDKLVIGHILKIEPHPDADKLVLATVDIGSDTSKVTVTGAPNLFEFKGKGDISQLGLKSPFVMEGATINDPYKKGKKMKLKARKIRGIMNRHMLCSEKELGISDEHEGIILMHTDAKSGTPLVDVLGDVILEFDVLPNIARTASIIGVAREIAALTGKKVRYPDISFEATGADIHDQLKIETTRPDLNPRFVSILVEGATVKPSPYWMQYYLRLAGMRPINNIVDVSNYVMLETGEPNHMFDWDMLKERAKTYSENGLVHIITRMAEKEEKLKTLDGEWRDMPESAILVTDPKSALSVGAIMGGAESDVHKTSTNLLIEAASWDFINIRQTSSALKLSSEASYRFSRGIHPAQAMFGAKRVAHLIQKLAGGVIAQGIYDNYPNPAKPITIDLTPHDVERSLGVQIDLATIRRYLEGLEFTCQTVGDNVLRVTAPDHRLDINPDPIIGKADLIEEIVRMYGYDNIPHTDMSDTLPQQRNITDLQREERIRDLLVNLGLHEVITYRLTTPESEHRLGTTPVPENEYVCLLNPSSTERRVMRRSLLNSVLDVCSDNARHANRIQLFELGHIYIPVEDELLPLEEPRLCLVMMGERGFVSWLDSESSQVDFYDLKGVMESLLHGLHITNTSYTAITHPSYHPGRVATLSIGNEEIGMFGQLHPDVVSTYDMETDNPVMVADLNLERLCSHVDENYPTKSIPRFPSVQQDIAVIVDEDMKATEVEHVIRESGGFLLADVRLFDVYRGKQLPPNTKSLAYNLFFQAPDKTLTDKVVAKQHARIVKKLEKKLGAKLRS